MVEDQGLREALARYEAADERCACAFTSDMRGTLERRTAEDERRNATVALAEAARTLLAQHPTPPAGAGAEAEQFCECSGFTSCVEQGLIKRADHQLYNSQTGALRQTHYYFIGPKGPKGAIIAHCPSCGRLVKANRDFLALAQAQAEGGEAL